MPIFISGVEAHAVVRDWLAPPASAAAAPPRAGSLPPLRPGFVEADAVISTIGFPLVGGPAGSMEGGRQADVARDILQSKGVPYIVAAPLLVQDVASWARDGVGGLQSVVRSHSWGALRLSCLFYLICGGLPGGGPVSASPIVPNEC